MTQEERRQLSVEIASMVLLQLFEPMKRQQQDILLMHEKFDTLTNNVTQLTSLMRETLYNPAPPPKSQQKPPSNLTVVPLKLQPSADEPTRS